MAEAFTKIIFGDGLYGTEVDDEVVRVDSTLTVVEVVRLAADAPNSTITKVALPGMSFPLDASTNYAFEFHCYTTSNAATIGVQFGLTFSGTVTNARVVAQLATGAAAIGWFGATAFPATFNPTTSQGNVPALNVIEGLVEVNAAGVLQLTHSSETATLTTVHRGSWGKATIIP